MLKKILLYGFLTVVLSIVAFVVYKFKTVPEQVIPYPYTFTANPPSSEIEGTIALMGDRMGKKLFLHISALETELSKGLATPLKVQNLSSAHEGLHRTLQKLKSLKKMPKVILYHGGSEEFYEKKFRTQDSRKILRNFALYSRSSVQTALLFSPALSHFIYQPVESTVLPLVPQLDNSNYSASDVFARQEVEFKLYSQTFKEFVEYVKSHDSILVLISTPYNMDEPPHKICESSTSSDYEAKKMFIEEHKKAGDYKSLLSLLEELIKVTPGNSLLHFEMGQALKSLGRKAEGLLHIEYSMAYDCDMWRGGEIYNVIAKRVAAENEIFYFDFSSYMKDQWGMNELFVDELYPQTFYYERALNNLGALLKKQLKI